MNPKLPQVVPTVMPVQGIRTVASSRVSLELVQFLLCGQMLIKSVEWPRRLHPSMQTPRLPLLRLGRQLQWHEVRRLLLSITPSSLLRLYLTFLLKVPSSNQTSSQHFQNHIRRSRSEYLLVHTNTQLSEATTSMAARKPFASGTWRRSKCSRRPSC